MAQAYENMALLAEIYDKDIPLAINVLNEADNLTKDDPQSNERIFNLLNRLKEITRVSTK
jgi:hypothetical protein